MGKLTIHTAGWGERVSALAAQHGNMLWQQRDGGTVSFGVAWRGDGFPQGLMGLLFDACVAGNAVYTHSPKLRAAAEKLRGGQLYEQEGRALRAFLRDSKTLNVEGYVAFRMEDLREKLDLMIFQILRDATKSTPEQV